MWLLIWKLWTSRGNYRSSNSLAPLPTSDEGHLIFVCEEIKCPNKWTINPRWYLISWCLLLETGRLTVTFPVEPTTRTKTACHSRIAITGEILNDFLSKFFFYHPLGIYSWTFLLCSMCLGNFDVYFYGVKSCLRSKLCRLSLISAGKSSAEASINLRFQITLLWPLAFKWLLFFY